MSHNPMKPLPDEVADRYSPHTPRKFRKIPVVIDAMQWRGPEDDHALGIFLSENGWGGKWCHNSEGLPCIKTLESGTGFHIVSPGDFVIKGVKNEFYACKPDIFALTYEATE